MEQRLKTLSTWMTENDITLSFITSTPNVFYFSKFYSDPHERLLGLLVFQTEEPILVCPNMEVGQARNAGWSFDIISYSDTDDPWEMIHHLLKQRNLNINKIAIEKEHVNVERYEKLLKIFQGASFISAEDKLHELRMIKDDKEIAIMRQAAELADFGVEIGVREIAEGKSEIEILATIEYELKKKGISKMSFDTMVLTGKKTASPHGKPGLAEIQKGDFVLFDLGVVLDGYCSDITRTVALGHVSEKQREIYETVLKAQLEAINISRVGVEIGKVDQAARNIIQQAGYGEYFTHRIGHGLGIEVHEYPSMNATNNSKLIMGMTYTIEPGIYVPNVGGVRIEDDIFITNSGAEVLTKYPKELVLI